LHRAWIRYPIPDENANVWMVQELVSGAIEKTNGNVTCADALNQPDHWRE
jgi:putative acetyltransferase